MKYLWASNGRLQNDQTARMGKFQLGFKSRSGVGASPHKVSGLAAAAGRGLLGFENDVSGGSGRRIAQRSLAGKQEIAKNAGIRVEGKGGGVDIDGLPGRVQDLQVGAERRRSRSGSVGSVGERIVTVGIGIGIAIGGEEIFLLVD